MSSWSVSNVTQSLSGALRKAAEATGAGFDYLVKTAMRESSMDPTAKASSSSAAGMFQFVDQTWLEMVKEAGPQYGLDAEAAAITRTPSGRYTVSDPQQKAKILALRYEPETAALMAGAFTERNEAVLTSALRRPPSDGELYTAHFLGAQGAVDLIRLASAAPEASAASYFPEAASANRSIFFSQGKALGAKDVLARLVQKHQATPTAPAATASTLVAANQTSGSTTPRVLSYADQKPVFHSLFGTEQRPPVSSYVQGIWSGLVPAKADWAAGAASDARVQNASTRDAPTSMPLDLSSYLKPGIASNSNLPSAGRI